ncbi:MAG: serine hydrolase domain-containing protein [Steroidobacteraceae bacterium]
MLRRLCVLLVASGALLLSAGIGLLSADWPFLHRVWQVPVDRADWRAVVPTPVATIDGGGSAFFPSATGDERTIDPAALADALAWAQSNGSAALLVLHADRLQLERYWQGLARDTLYPVLGASRSLLGVAFGFAEADGLIDSLDAPVERWLSGWRDEARGAITLRELLWNVSGLEVADATQWPGRLGRSGRLLYGTATERAALSFGSVHEAGTYFALSPVDAELLAIVLERASGVRYETYIARSLWRAIGAGVAGFSLDRRGGRAVAFDGLRAAPGDLLRLGALLANDGRVAGRAVLPPGWVADLSRGSMPNPEFGLDAWSFADHRLRLSGDGRVIWILPDDRLVIVRLGPATPGWDSADLPDIVRRGLHR